MIKVCIFKDTKNSLQALFTGPLYKLYQALNGLTEPDKSVLKKYFLFSGYTSN